MKARRNTTKQTVYRGDLLDQKWMTYFLTVVLMLLIVVFVVLSSPVYKKYVMERIKSVFYGAKEKAPRPRAAPVKFQIPLLSPGLKFYVFQLQLGTRRN